ncbi:hypothetical protein [Flavobacterium chilense]|uniref:Uncharacterized protein n=1 Tax=Flavobacterium chilense TaxID=946677 RepID=A0A1M7F9G3_9FLAO|nr:hypothetical protein [Flavobacterium chilense]SHM00722.1 hypothetical protein SAMN05444484_103285 [Flavobacterium chilense]
MHNIKKVIELLSKKYSYGISVLSNSSDGKYNSILDTQNGTLFSVSYNSLYVFKDSDNNFWSTIPKSFVYNDKKYYPKLGEEYTRKDGVKYSFTTKEEVLKMATSYFERFTNPYRGIKVASQGEFLSNNTNKSQVKYDLILEKFQSKVRNKIHTSFSFN